MTPRRYSARPGTCTVPGCDKPRHISKHGRVYTRCDDHYRAAYKFSAQRRKDVPPETHRLKSIPAPDSVRVLVIDWKTEQVFHVTGMVECSDQFPCTEGEMKKMIARASQRGIYVAYMRAYKEEDLHEV